MARQLVDSLATLEAEPCTQEEESRRQQEQQEEESRREEEQQERKEEQEQLEEVRCRLDTEVARLTDCHREIENYRWSEKELK